jgi:iron complex outermembrane receptor protein
VTIVFMRASLAAVTTLALCGFVIPANAQSPNQSSADQAGAAGLEEVVVTARRREEKLQTVPLSVQAFSADRLQQHHIENATDLSKIVPSLNAAESSRNEENYVIRGQSGSGASISGQQVTVPTYFSQVPLPIGDGGGPGRYFDLQNVQVLKGPQGTLFGRNSTGGAVLFEPQRPTMNFEGFGQVQFGNYNDHGFEGAINVPVIQDKLALRFAAKAEERDGFTKDITNGQELDDRNYISGRISALWRPADMIENLVIADYYNTHTAGTSNELSNYNPGNTLVKLFGNAVPNAFLRQQALGARMTTSETYGLDRIEAWGISDIATWDIAEDLTFKTILGYRSFKQLNRFDYDGSSLTFLGFDACQFPAQCHTASPDSPWTVNVEQFTAEPQLQGKLFGDRLTYTLGLFLSNSDSPASNYNHQSSVFGSVTDANSKIDDRSRAVYTQETYDLSDFIEGLKITGGYRYTQDHRALTISQATSGKCNTGKTGTLAPDPANAPQCLANFSTDHGSTSYTAGLDYQLNADTLLYVIHRRGYRAGGINALAGPVLLANPPIPNAIGLFTYGPESIIDTEIGVKADWKVGEVPVRTNLSGYHSMVHNAQLNQTFGVGSLNVSALTNVTEAEVNGVEFDFTVVPVPPLEISGSYGYTQATYGPYLDYNNRNPLTQQPTLSTGRAYPFTPLNKFNISARYHVPIPEQWGELYGSISWLHKSHVLLGLIPFYTNAGVIYGDPAAYQGDVDTYDLTIDLKHAAGTAFDVSFFVTNLTDATYKIGGASLIASSLGIDQAIYNEPRMFGFQIRYNFGPGE